MTTLEKVRTFLRNNSEVSIGYNEIIFFPADELDSAQIGYSIDTNNNSLITGQDGDWQDGWLVIGVDSLLGDPIFVDTSTKQLRVLTATHGEGEWETILIADSLDSFADIISELKILSEDRISPMDFERNPISTKEFEKFIARVKKNNSEVEIDYWENFIESD